MTKFVHEIMNRELFSLRPQDSTEDALGYLMALGISGAPVANPEGKPMGVISMRDVLLKKSARTVAECMSQPAVTVSVDASVTEAGMLLARHEFHRVVAVDSEGRGVGLVSTLDVVRALVGLPAQHPETFPHFDRSTGLSWTNDCEFNLEQADKAPDGPGVLVLRVGGTHVTETDVWAETCHNVRSRVHELLSIPQTNRHLASLLERQQGALRFRAAAVRDPERRRKALEQLLAHADAWLTGSAAE